MPEIISRAEAKARGLKRYYTGKPCIHGHGAERLTSDCGCCVCAVRKASEYCRRHREWKRRRDNDYRWRNIDKIQSKDRERARIWRSNNREKNYEKQKRYRLKDPEKWNESKRRWAAQNSEKAKLAELKYRLNGPANPKDEKQWLKKARAQLRNLKRLLRHPNQDHSNWLKEAPRP